MPERRGRPSEPDPDGREHESQRARHLHTTVVCGTLACMPSRHISADDYDSIMETRAILSDQDLMRELRAAEAEAAAGRVFTLDEVTEEMRAAGRLPEG